MDLVAEYQDEDMRAAIKRNGDLPQPELPKEPARVKRINRPSWHGWLNKRVVRILRDWSTRGFWFAVSQQALRMVAWPWGWGYQTFLFLAHFVTFRWFVDDAAYDWRMEVCRTCPALQEQDDETYCGMCGCPKWALSKLRRKNRLRKHLCPAGYHPGSNPGGDTEIISEDVE